ncbi:ATP-dependent RNA helicase dbp10 [Neophaeococcomyces mojaviensis]|uniref:ATP-dependent RNA helicase dbp10 n=1 Tax=Neophaeococcomyces mojaviensis TaxID=3383035 RepID=A0ACC3AIY6_9EURO|nr:ATP-dependent RNA helicase dbp10 [Knufia sp. JES_112]
MPVRAPSPALSENEIDIGSALFGGGVDVDGSDVDQSQVGKGAGLNGRDAEAANIFAQDSDSDAAIIAQQQAASNRKASNLKGRTVKKGGGFQAMGLSANLLKAITRKGFSVPTPIQRKTIPLLLNQKDVVGMARTGSGKTAAFIIPMIERLKTHNTQVGARALILSPSRELALQTLQVTKELARGTDLRCILLVGGDSLEEQFAAMSSNPDIVIAAPGRFVHLVVEMNLDLSSMQYVVFDEADRLFEMGFAAQLAEILHKLPTGRQTLLFSATLPKSLVEFARAGLVEPVLVRLDAEGKISPDLQSAFFTVKSSEKEGALLHILQDVIHVPSRSNPQSAEGSGEVAPKGKKRKRSDEEKDGQKPSTSPYSTIIFAATKHRVEYLDQLLRKAGYAVSHVYGNLDQTARKQQVQAFRSGQTNILVVTDVAARGIDIPILANVINYDFPSQAKIYVHRVGRTARAGQKGWSYSIIHDADAPYLLDLQLFLGRKLSVGRAKLQDVKMAEEVVVGSLPRDQMQTSCEWVSRQLEVDTDLYTGQSAAVNGDKRYQQTRNSASAESAKRARDLIASPQWSELHPLFANQSNDMEAEREKMLAIVGGFRPEESIFEIGARRGGKKNNEEAIVAIRKIRSGLDVKKQKSLASKIRAEEVDATEEQADDIEMNDTTHEHNGFDSDADEDEIIIQNPEALDSAADSDLEATFANHKPSNKKHKPGNHDYADQTNAYRSANFMSYTPANHNAIEDAAYSVNQANDFTTAARGATMDLNGDENTGSNPTQIMRWDKRHKKYVRRTNDEDGSKGKRLVRGESGAKIAASFKSGRFDAWRKANKINRVPRVGEKESEGGAGAGARSMLGVKQRFKHKKMTEAKAPDRFRDDYEKRKKKVREARDQAREVGVVEKERVGGGGAKAKGKKGSATVGGGDVRGVRKGKITNSVEDIRKARKSMEKKREKNARPSRRGKGR